MDQEAQARRSGPTRTPRLQSKKRDIPCERAGFFTLLTIIFRVSEWAEFDSQLWYVAVVCVTIQLALNQVHPAADLVMESLHVPQQVQLTLSHGRRPGLLCRRLSSSAFAAVHLVFRFYSGVCHRVSAEIFR